MLEGMTDRSPRVTDDGWGYLEIEGIGRVRDAKLWPGGGRAWDWNETGTDHTPGISPDDVAELLEYDPEVVVLGLGREGALQVQPEAQASLERGGVAVVKQETADAIEHYNALAAEGRMVAALIHSTC